jgi:hypothetical protein
MPFSSALRTSMTERLRDLIAYVVTVGMLLAGSYISARLDTALVGKLRPHTTTADAVVTEDDVTRRAR